MLLFLIFFLLNVVKSEERVRLYDEWINTVEEIKTKDELFKLIPKSSESKYGTENNIILYLYNDNCIQGKTNPVFEGATFQTGPSVIHLATFNKKIYPNIINDWEMKNNCSQYVWIYSGQYYNDYKYFNYCPDSNIIPFTSWLKDAGHIAVPFKVQHNNPINFYWYERDEIFLRQLKNNEETEESTFVGHMFMARDSIDNYLIDIYLIKGNKQFIISTREQELYCESKEIINITECRESYEKEMIDSAYKFWARKREGLNYVQPKIVKSFTPMGFSRGTLPENIYSSILKFWNDKKSKNEFEEESYAGPVLNQYESPTFMAHLEPNERQLLIDFFQNILGKWGKIDPNVLEMTSLYGIRKYTRGAILGMHVDTCRSHVLSAIVNVDSNLDKNKEWPLQIYDHNGKLHEIIMKKGEYVLYESAKNGHARFKPLPGEFYANVFIHFAPKDKKIWNYDWF